MRFVARFVPNSFNHVRTIEWVVSVFTFIGGLYLFTPLYTTSVAQNGLTAMATAFSHPLMVFLWGALLLVGALAVIFGLWKNKPQIKSIGWFSILLARFFQLLTTFMVAGFLPISWIYPLTVTTVVLVLWIVARLEVRSLASS